MILAIPSVRRKISASTEPLSVLDDDLVLLVLHIGTCQAQRSPATHLATNEAMAGEMGEMGMIPQELGETKVFGWGYTHVSKPRRDSQTRYRLNCRFLIGFGTHEEKSMNDIQLLITLRLWVAGPPVSKVDRQLHLISSDHITSCSWLRNSGIPHWFTTGWFYSFERLCFIGYTLCPTSIYSTRPFRGWMGHASGWWVGNKVTSQVTMRPWTKRPRLSQLVLKQTLKQS